MGLGWPINKSKKKLMNLIFKTVVGSQAYGTSTPTSDADFKGVYVQPDDDILSFRYTPQVEYGKDETHYEIKRFLELAATANPTMLEMLFIDPSSDLCKKTSRAWEAMYGLRYAFLTKQCGKSFGGFAVQQIQKAKGLNKKMNWEKARVVRKNVLDFCFVEENGRSLFVSAWLAKEGRKQEYCGLVALDRMKDCYAIYYDAVAQYGAGNRNIPVLGYKGIAGEDSNDIRLSSVPKGATPIGVMYFGKDQYSQHCKDFREYQEWLEKRNTARYVDVEGHGQQIDGKNLLHCRRLIDCGLEIATKGTLTVGRPNADYLLKIRKGEVPLEQIIEEAERDLVVMDEAFQRSSLPEEVGRDYMNDIILYSRRLNREYK